MPLKAGWKSAILDTFAAVSSRISPTSQTGLQVPFVNNDQCRKSGNAHYALDHTAGGLTQRLCMAVQYKNLSDAIARPRRDKNGQGGRQ